MAKNVVHEGKRSWWNSEVRTRCGLRFSPSSKEAGLFASIDCPACKAARKAGKWL